MALQASAQLPCATALYFLTRPLPIVPASVGGTYTSKYLKEMRNTDIGRDEMFG